MADSRLLEFTLGAAIPVPVARIEQELAALWRTAAEEAEGHAVTRACLWNLIIHTVGPSAFQHAKRIVDEISPRLPARVLVLKTDCDRNADAPLAAWIEANWHAGANQQIGSEEVTLEAAGDRVDDLAPIVRALLVPDVPTAALWLDSSPSLGRPLDRELWRAANRVVIDGDDASSLRAMAPLLGSANRPSPDVITLSWLRSSGWRQLLAALFDPPTPPVELASISRVEIDCSGARTGAALLFVGWLAAQLRWRARRETAPFRYRFERDGGDVAVEVRIAPGATDPFARVAVTTPAGTYDLVRQDENVVMETPALAWKQPMHIPGDAELWLAALGGRGSDRLFSEAIGRSVSG